MIKKNKIIATIADLANEKNTNQHFIKLCQSQFRFDFKTLD